MRNVGEERKKKWSLIITSETEDGAYRFKYKTILSP